MTNVRELLNLNSEHRCRATNPECQQGKHENCDGVGWCADQDAAVDCTCACHRLAASPAGSDG